MSAKIVVITGASSGIGKAIALRVAAEGPAKYKLVLAARREAELQAVVEACGGASVAIGVVTDVTSRVAVAALLAKAVAHWGRIDVVINNAGAGCNVLPSALTDAIVDDMMTVNVKSSLYGMQEALPHFAKNEGGTGHIINVSSVLGRCPVPSAEALGVSAYTAAKHFLTALTDIFRSEMKQKGGSVVVSLYSPGVVGTDFGSVAGGFDSRLIPGAQDVDEVAANVFDELIVKRREDVYSREVYKTLIEGYLKDRHAQ